MARSAGWRAFLYNIAPRRRRRLLARDAPRSLLQRNIGSERYFMAARVITIAQQKGGGGQTTLAAHLAIAWAGAGRSVALVDIDPQGSLGAWHALREERLGSGNTGLDFAAI